MIRYPKFNKNGEKVLCKMDGIGKEMLMDISVFSLKAGTKKIFFKEDKEIVILLTNGKIRFRAQNIDEIHDRYNVFKDNPTTLHVCKGTKVIIDCIEDSEFIYQSTTNDNVFPAKLYRKEDVINAVGGKDVLENTMLRDINTIFDKSNAPYSNLVVGEVLCRQGRWWSYVPHYHPQPEVYYYKFEREEGFGASFIGETPYFVKDGSCCFIPPNHTHAQTTAPGYPMYCCWMIRHLDGNPWEKTRIVDERYKWLEEGSYGK